MKYLLVNVMGYNGYSIMVHGRYNERNEIEVIDACLKNDLFVDEEDANYANVVEADKYDIQMFPGAIYEI